MHELLRNLPPQARILDVGCAEGSFDAGGSFCVVRVDRDHAARRLSNFVQADAARLPFADHCFDVVVSNHSLEHFDDLRGSLREIGRVVRSSGALYFAVPDASTFCDRLYRWLARGGGHVNAFRSASDLRLAIERTTGLPHIATRTLCTSFSFLNRNNARARPPRRLLPLGGGTETSLRVFSYLFRLSDRMLGTRLSVYGWALYFGQIDGTIDTRTWTNVCLRCGSGHPAERLAHGRFFYRCPQCGTLNVFTSDEACKDCQ